MDAVNLAEAKARLSELVGRAVAGEHIQINLRGQPAVRLVPVEAAPQAFDWTELKAFTDALPVDPVDTVTEMRRNARY